MAEALGRASLLLPSNHMVKGHSVVSVLPWRCRNMRLKSVKLRSSLSWSGSGFYDKRMVAARTAMVPKRSSPRVFSVDSQMIQGNLGIAKAPKWWEKGMQPNMREVIGAQDLIDSLMNAGDKLVVVDFFSPGCGGCRALHPKICQLAEMNPDVQFLQVNYEEHKSMCYTLNVHVLPFFRFYRGSQGRVCSFSCTVATIKKFKDALAKHTPDRCSLGPTKGLEEKELLSLSANRELSFTYQPKPAHVPELDVVVPEQPPSHLTPGTPLPLPLAGLESAPESKEKSTLASSGR
ncbi:hypothetical protein SAY86_026884 [Trapa natans]|uniref:Thioredoxin domain-containing protein n=1 Tax=Trapa natans TaxID=22666 RepID=A0AAN7KPR7_TRANT|nr:hypothetical protein SAY86_026884 [Trapa natans]